MATRLAAPGAGSARPGVVGGSGHRHGAVQVVQRQLEVSRANRDVGLAVIDLVRREAVHADFFGRPARRGGHDLHQARGPHARARIHDETAFLADQAIDVRRVQVDGLAVLHHGFAEGHGEALVKVGHGGGALAGVDAAVPDLAVAGKLGGGQQFTLTHAAFLVQVGGVVPFAHAFGAQADGNGVGTPVQAGVEPRDFSFSRRQRRGLGRR